VLQRLASLAIRLAPAKQGQQDESENHG
jgi:hypothetical protein